MNANINFNDAINFVLRWFFTGLVLYFGWNAGQWLDAFIPNPPA